MLDLDKTKMTKEEYEAACVKENKEDCENSIKKKCKEL